MKERIYLALTIIPTLLNGMQPPAKKARLNKTIAGIPPLKDLAANAVASYLMKPEQLALYRQNKTIYNLSLNYIPKDIKDLISHKITALPLLFTFEHEDSITAANFSKNGNHIVTASHDGMARLWNSKTGKCLRAFSHKGPINSAVFNYNNKEILTTCSPINGMLKEAACINIETGGRPKIFYHHEIPMRKALFNADCSRIITLSDGSALLWDARTSVRTSVELQTFFHENLITASFNHNATRILTVASSSVKLWDATHYWLDKKPGQAFNEDLCLKTFTSEGSFASAVFNHNSTMILTASTDGTAKLWNATSGECVHTFNHDAAVSLAIFNHNSTRILTISHCAVQLWDVVTRELLGVFTHSNKINSVEFNDKGTRILTSSDDGIAKLWDIITYELLQIFDHQQSITAARFNHDGTRVLTIANRTVKLWNSDAITFEQKLSSISGADVGIISTIKNTLLKLWA